MNVISGMHVMSVMSAMIGYMHVERKKEKHQSGSQKRGSEIQCRFALGSS